MAINESVAEVVEHFERGITLGLEDYLIEEVDKGGKHPNGSKRLFR